MHNVRQWTVAQFKMAPRIDLLCCAALPAVINLFGRYTYLSAHQPLNVRTHLERYDQAEQSQPLYKKF